MHAIAGTYVVLLGLDLPKARTKGLLGFAVERWDPTENERYWLRGMKTFKETSAGVPPGSSVSLREHPVQSFLWGDYTAKPGREYEYRVVALYGAPKNLEIRQDVTVAVTTESVDQGTHAVFFNRGVAGSQAYARRFGRAPREDDRSDPAYDWLSRGLEEALLSFIESATGAEFSLRGAVYEFTYPRVLDALAAAAARGVDLQIVYDRRGKPSDDPEREKVWQESEPAIKAAGLEPFMIPRRTNSAIAHNKFFVLLRNGVPEQVWTGSANISWGGLFGQSNVGHLVRDPDTATLYLEYWERLAADPSYAVIRPANTTATPTPTTPPPAGIAPLFSPRTSLDLMHWYAAEAAAAKKSFFMTAAFGVDDTIADVIKPPSDVMRYLILERPPRSDEVQFTTDHNLKVAVGSFLRTDKLDRWVKEQLTGLNSRVRYTHNKFMLIDPLGNAPLVIAGSANFSDPSVNENDENMLVIQGDSRVADIYLGEFMRIFNHFYVRYLTQILNDTDADGSGYLSPDDGWTTRYFDQTTPSYRQRLLFR
ncbi:phospholipase D-like domain-containing protein [Kribbella sp. C-35]|uniref:phospholipase D-like domain-containing protein n=1 Tax=Kribbella sp. C-35 TaxID=2789276 RepID=UPI00397E24BE